MSDTIDPAELRQVLSTFITGVTVITTLDANGQPHGLTANSFNSVSLDPPLVLWSQGLKARSHPIFREAERFAVNILADDQIPVSSRFAKAGEDKFGPTPVRNGLGGVPLIEGCSAWLECRRVAAHAAGDHMIFIGEVQRIERSGRRPLAFGGGRYLIPQAHDFARLSADEANLNRSRLQAVRLATHAAVELAARLDVTIGVAVWGTHGPTVVHWELSHQPVSVNLRPGAVLPMFGSATGRVFAAWLPADETAARIDGDRPDVTPDLSAIRNAGLASLATVSRFQGGDPIEVQAISVPVLDPSGGIILALTALAEHHRLDPAADAPVAKALRACAAELGHRVAGH
jgi:flavin reductase (DIM6/NTAB) family NADH-FMN oxidoreductase RutF/DNA-binding IclR family transcriptional regulator